MVADVPECAGLGWVIQRYEVFTVIGLQSTEKLLSALLEQIKASDTMER